jgi:polyhydroxyalkanoate synthesis regulator phasin
MSSIHRIGIGVILVLATAGGNASRTFADYTAQTDQSTSYVDSLGYELEEENPLAEEDVRWMELPAATGLTGDRQRLRKLQEENDASMDDLDRRVNSLRGQVQDLKSEILTLGEHISQGFVTGTKLLIIHENNMGSAFTIESIEYKLDGFTVYSVSDPERIAANRRIVVFDASVLPGNHTVDAIYTLRSGGYGIFTYVEQYQFDLRNQYHFATPRGKAVELVVQAIDTGAGKQLQERPALRFNVR